MLGTSPFLELILLLSALPAIAISRREVTRWRSGVTFVAFYPAMVLMVGSASIMLVLLLAPLGVINFG